MLKLFRKCLLEYALRLLLIVITSHFLISCTPNGEERPNIIIIFADDLGYADIGHNGAEGFTTPNIDRMADEGMMLTDFHVSTSVCSASRSSLLTGCYSERVSIRGALNPAATIGINPDEVTIAEMLKKKNYYTGVFGKWHLGHHKEFLPLQHGFDEYYGLPYSNDMWPVHYNGKRAENWKSGYPELILIEDNDSSATVMDLEDQARLTTTYTDKAVDFINRNAEENFFLYLAHSMPHVPLGVSEKYDGQSEQGMYGDVIMEIDWSVGEILKALKENNIDDNTLVIFTSDNGPWLNYGNHAGSAKPLREGKGTMWEGGVRVPCVIRWPDRISRNSVSDKLISTMDIFPTIAEITKSDLPQNKIDGVSFLSVLLGDEEYTPREELWYYYNRDLIAVRKNEWKLFFPSIQRSYEGMEPGNDGFPGPTWQKQIDYALYNLREDIGEKDNVFDKYPDIVDELKSIGDRARLELGDRLTNTRGNEIRDPGRIGSDRIEYQENLATNQKISLSNFPSVKYGTGDEKIIVDGWKGSRDHNDGRWLGFEGIDLSAVVDLGQVTELNDISISFLQNQMAWIFYPSEVSFSVSRDGKQFKKIKQFDSSIQPQLGSLIKDYSVKLQYEKFRFVKIDAENIKICPDWHGGKGGKAWIFVDEIQIK